MDTLTKEEFGFINSIGNIGGAISVFLSKNKRLTAEQARTFLKRAKEEMEEDLTQPYSSYVLLTNAHWFNAIIFNIDCKDPEYEVVWREGSSTKDEMYSKIEKYIKAN